MRQNAMISLSQSRSLCANEALCPTVASWLPSKCTSHTRNTSRAFLYIQVWQSWIEISILTTNATVVSSLYSCLRFHGLEVLRPPLEIRFKGRTYGCILSMGSNCMVPTFLDWYISPTFPVFVFHFPVFYLLNLTNKKKTFNNYIFRYVRNANFLWSSALKLAKKFNSTSFNLKQEVFIRRDEEKTRKGLIYIGERIWHLLWSKRLNCES